MMVVGRSLTMKAYLILTLSFLLGFQWVYNQIPPMRDFSHAHANFGYRELVPPIVPPKKGSLVTFYGLDLYGTARSHQQAYVPCEKPLMKSRSEIYIAQAYATRGWQVIYHVGCETFAESKK